MLCIMTERWWQTPLAQHLFIFTGVLVGSLIIQSVLWLSLPYADEHYWVTDLEKMLTGSALGPTDITFVHPGTALQLASLVTLIVGTDPALALRLVLAACVALGAALGATIAYHLRPNSLWWLTTALIVGGNIQLLHVTPPSVLASLAALLFIFALLYVQKTPGQQKSVLLLGVCTGALLASRVDIAVFIIVTALPLTWYLLRGRTLIVLAVAGITFILLDPHMRNLPGAHFASMYSLFTTYSTAIGIPIFATFLKTFPIALGSILLSILLVGVHKTFALPRGIYFWFLGTTVLFTLLLVPRDFHPIRYFMPLYFVWNVLFPLLVFSWIPWILPYITARIPQCTEHRLTWVFVGLVALHIPLSIAWLLATGPSLTL